MFRVEQSAALLRPDLTNSRFVPQRGDDPQDAIQPESLLSRNVSSAFSDSTLTTVTASNDKQQTFLHPVNEKDVEPAVSVHTVDSQNSSLRNNENALGRPSRRRKFKILDTLAVLSSLACLIIGIIIILPSLTISWRLGFQSQIIAIGFLIGVMNICAERVVPSCFIAIEARFGKSRLQNYDAILTSKFLSPHIGILWRLAIILFLALPLALSVGYKQFLGGTSSADVAPLQGEYGVYFPIIGDWTPIQDPIYLMFSSNAAFHSYSMNTESILNGSNSYPIPFGFNVLLMAEDSAAVLDLPSNDYLKVMRSKFKTGETWQLSASVDAYVATTDNATASTLRSDDSYWESAVNESYHGLVSYYLNQDANTYIGMLPIIGQPYCWMGLFRGGPSTDSMYSKDLNDANIVGFRKSAALIHLSRQRCQATWEINESGMRLTSAICANSTDAAISQEPVLGCTSCPWTVEANPGIPHIFSRYVTGFPNSPWISPSYVVTTATSYWARGVYMIHANGFRGFNYTGIDEEVTSTRQTLESSPLLFLCLAIQPVLTIIALLVKSLLSMPFSGDFGMIAVLAGIKHSSLSVLRGAGFSGELKRPLKLEISLAERRKKELGGMSVATVKYELKTEGTGKYRVPKADGDTLYI